jgi:hypothetical protein
MGQEICELNEWFVTRESQFVTQLHRVPGKLLCRYVLTTV